MRGNDGDRSPDVGGARRFVFLGKPGSGKGTQAARLSERLSLPHLSSGEMLRKEIAEGTPMGMKVSGYVERGEIGPEELITSLVLERMERKGHADGYILDGFPRTPYQAERLDESWPPAKAVLLDIDDEEVIRRLAGRLTCEDCGAVYHEQDDPPQTPGECDRCGGRLVKREDDRPEAIRRRLEVFIEESLPVTRIYRDSGRLLRVDASGTPDEVFESIMNGL